MAGERRIVVGEQSFQKALRLLHRFHVEGGGLTAPRVGLGCEGECISDQRASGEILAKITPGRIAILCNGVKLFARFDELARVECGGCILIGAIGLQESRDCRQEQEKAWLDSYRRSWRRQRPVRESN